LVQNAEGIGGATGQYPAWPQSIQRRDRLTQRPAETTDNDFLLTLFGESRPDLALIPEPVRASLIRMQFDSQLSQYRASAPDAVDWILELDADAGPEPVGRCYLRQGAEEHRLLDLAIRAEWRGRGIGSAVLEQLRAGAARAGVPLRLSVWQGNEGAIRLYRRLGFVEEFAKDFVKDGADGGYLRMQWTPPELNR